MQTLHAIGNAHIDPVWLWRWPEGAAEIRSTFLSALQRMDEFPDYIFTSACAAYYRYIERTEPELFERIRQRVAEGRWALAGGWWIQPDCNIPSGESYARHALYSQRYFEAVFGRRATIGYNVDSFGHNGMLPQLLKLGGLTGYIFMRPSDRERELPEAFLWRSPDGSEIPTVKLGEPYNTDAPEKLRAKFALRSKLAQSLRIPLPLFFGVGNHGGGPTIHALKTLENIMSQQPDSLTYSDPARYFKALEQHRSDLPIVDTDLQHHASGCYAAVSQIKRDNRRAEQRLLMAERFAAVAHRITGSGYPRAQLQEAWEGVLFNQFHDIMGGCSVEGAYEDAKELHGRSLALAADVLNEAVQRLSYRIDTMPGQDLPNSKHSDFKLWLQDDLPVPIAVFNPLPYPVTAPVTVNAALDFVTDAQHATLPVQPVRAEHINGPKDKYSTLFLADLPPLGYRLFWGKRGGKAEDDANSTTSLIANDNVLENRWWRLETGDNGCIKRLFDKQHGREVLSAPSRAILINEESLDTWAHAVDRFRDEAGVMDNGTSHCIEHGPLRATLRAEASFEQSTIRQDFILYRDIPRIDVVLTVDWRHVHRMLKLSLPVALQGQPISTFDIAYGHMALPNNGDEQPGQRWADVSGQDGTGLTLVNDCKYSYDVLDHDLRLTLVRSPLFADHFGQHDRDDFCVPTDQGPQRIALSLIPHTMPWQDAHVDRAAGELHQPPIVVLESYHNGPLPAISSFLSVDAPNVEATVLKLFEDGEDLILRCHETQGLPASARISVLGIELHADFTPQQIRTFKIGADDEITDVNFLEEAL